MIFPVLFPMDSSPRGAVPAGRFDQSPRVPDYPLDPTPHPGLYGDFPATIRRFP